MTTHTDQNPAPAQHNRGCTEWCNHCALCGKGVLYGARCIEHMGVYPSADQGVSA